MSNVYGKFDDKEVMFEKAKDIKQEDQAMLDLWRDKWNTEQDGVLQKDFVKNIGKETLEPIFLDKLHLALADLWLLCFAQRRGYSEVPDFVDLENCESKNVELEKEG